MIYTYGEKEEVPQDRKNLYQTGCPPVFLVALHCIQVVSGEHNVILDGCYLRCCCFGDSVCFVCVGEDTEEEDGRGKYA